MSALLTFHEVQEKHRIWLLHNFGPDVDSYRPLLGAMEELGELAHAHLKEVDGIRGTPEELRAQAQDAIGDIVMFLCGYCSLRGFNLGDCAQQAWEQISQRDWTQNKRTGIKQGVGGSVDPKQTG